MSGVLIKCENCGKTVPHDSKEIERHKVVSKRYDIFKGYADRTKYTCQECGETKIHRTGSGWIVSDSKDNKLVKIR